MFRMLLGALGCVFGAIIIAVSMVAPAPLHKPHPLSIAAFAFLVFVIPGVWAFWAGRRARARVFGPSISGRGVGQAAVYAVGTIAILIPLMNNDRKRKDAANGMIAEKFAGVIAEVDAGGFTPVTPPPYLQLSGKVLPFIKTPRDEKQQRIDKAAFWGSFFWEIPDDLRPEDPDDVANIAIFDFGWKAVGAYKVIGTSLGQGRAYIGTCQVTVIDRKEKTIVGSWLYTSQQKPPDRKKTTMNWYGNPVSDEELVTILRGGHREMLPR